MYNRLFAAFAAIAVLVMVGTTFNPADSAWAADRGLGNGNGNGLSNAPGQGGAGSGNGNSNFGVGHNPNSSLSGGDPNTDGGIGGGFASDDSTDPCLNLKGKDLKACLKAFHGTVGFLETGKGKTGKSKKAVEKVVDVDFVNGQEPTAPKAGNKDLNVFMGN